jgi:hypothetical protein
MTKNIPACLTAGHGLWGRPERESRTPVNIVNQHYRDNGEGVAGRPLPYPLVFRRFGSAFVKGRAGASGLCREIPVYGR